MNRECRNARRLLAGAFALLCTPVPATAETVGYLSVNSGPAVYDSDLAMMIDQHFQDGSMNDGQVDSDVLLIHTACYGAKRPGSGNARLLLRI